MFRATQDQPFIPSKSIAIFPDVVSDVQAQDEIRFSLPTYLGFVDPSQTYLNFDLTMTGIGFQVPDPVAGAHSLFRNVIVRDGSNSATISKLEDYNGMVAKTRTFTEQTSVEHKRQLFEGVQARDSATVKTLYYDTYTIDPTSTNVLPFTTPRGKNTVNVNLQLESGLFLGSNIIPVAALNGLRIQIDTEVASRACTYNNLDCGSKEPISTIADIADTDYETTVDYEQFFIATGHSLADNYFSIGDNLWIELTSGATRAELGFITGFYVTGSTKLGIMFCSQRTTGSDIGTSFPIGSKLYYDSTSRVNGGNYFVQGGAIITNPPLGYTISTLKMNCMTVQPPPQYVEGIMKKASSSEGFQFDLLDVELHRHNQIVSSGLAQIPIPTRSTRAKSIFCQPIPVSTNRDINSSSFRGVPDNAIDYQFVLGSQLIPSRKAPLSRYSQTELTSGTDLGEGQSRSEPLHLVELQKAIVNINKSVRSLQKIANNFSIARALNRYGQVTDLSNDSLSLLVEYAPGAVEKIFNNYVYKMVRVSVKNNIVSVM